MVKEVIKKSVNLTKKTDCPKISEKIRNRYPIIPG